MHFHTIDLFNILIIFLRTVTYLLNF